VGGGRPIQCVVIFYSYSYLWRSVCGTGGDVRITDMEIPLKYDDISFNLHNLGKYAFTTFTVCNVEKIFSK
jgi:hypothetical protein